MMRLGVTFAAGVGAASAFVAAGLAQSGGNAGLTYAGTTWPATLALVVAAVGLFAAAPVARTPFLGVLALCAGTCWLAPIWAAWQGGPPAIRATSTLAAAFALPVVAHLALAAPAGRLDSGLGRAVVAVAYAWSALAAVTLALFRDPFYDPSCWSDCDGNAFLLVSKPGLSSQIEHLRPWVELGLGIAVVAFGIVALRRAGAAGRVSGLAASAVGAVAALHAVRVLGTPFEDPLDPEFRAVFIGGCAAVVLVSVAVATTRVLLPLRRRILLAALDETLPPLEVERRLRSALDDPTLRIVFPLPELGRSVDASGEATPVPPASGDRAVTPLARRGDTVAWIEHASRVADAVEPALTSAVRLAVDNARLRAGLLAQVRDLRAARRRIVSDGDDERRRLERDLHDGVQQVLLALAGEVGAAAALARAADDPAAGALEDAVVRTASLLEEVRDVAHGIYPAILTDAGLAPAVASLADVAALPVSLGHLSADRFPPAVEAAAYQVVAEGIANAAAHSAASVVDVEIIRLDGTLVVRVRDDGHGGASLEPVGGLAELVDRVGAIDGTVSVESNPASGTTVGAVIPCVS
jgi:signal transduction histidine kinase